MSVFILKNLLDLFQINLHVPMICFKYNYINKSYNFNII
jgi:hypothetical protein